MGDERYKIALKIVEMTDAYEAGQLKRTARDFISGMVKAYQILIDAPSTAAAYEDAKSQVAQRDWDGDEDPVKFDEQGDRLWQETLAGN